MEITVVIAVCVIGSLLALMLRQHRPELAMLLSLGCGVVVVIYMLDGVAQIRSELEQLLRLVNLPTEVLEVVFKGLGICILSEFASQSCRDAGEKSIALKAELAGKIAIVMISMPLFMQLLQLAAGLLSVVG